MKIIKPSVEFFGAVPTDYTNALRFIEMAGRTCYKSEDKITEDSAEGFVKRLISAGHLAMVEHSNFVVRVAINTTYAACARAVAGKYMTVLETGGFLYAGGNLTAWAQANAAASTLKPSMFVPFSRQYSDVFDISSRQGGDNSWQVCPHNEIPPALHRYSAKFVCDRGVSHELVRHRPCSFAQESTRYVNYGGKDMEFVEPAGFEGWSAYDQNLFENACFNAALTYKQMVNGGAALKPQQARAVLPNALKTEIIITADAAEWAHIKKLRTHPSAHPDMVRVMNMMSWEEMGL